MAEDTLDAWEKKELADEMSDRAELSRKFQDGAVICWIRMNPKSIRAKAAAVAAVAAVDGCYFLFLCKSA
jgi:hypothetical protein